MDYKINYVKLNYRSLVLQKKTRSDLKYSSFLYIIKRVL